MKGTMLTACLIGVVIGLCLGVSVWAEEKMPVVESRPPIETLVVEQKPLIQMAILLDTSGSMSGLIDQARTELWAIVNEFIFAKRNGKEPELQVALYEYGKSSLSSKVGYIRQIVPLTTDLDKISEELFALKTNGGQEYCGWVIKEATQLLQWSSSPDDLKVIFIAGNEPFTQGPVDYKKSCKAAVSKGIIVNTIHCGSHEQGISGKWKDGSLLADGQYLNINHNRRAVHIEAPQDKKLIELSNRLNGTYIVYGARGRQFKANQVAQDLNALNVSGANASSRAMTKSSQFYRNDSWDIVDALKHDKVKLEEIKNEDLPENMQKMSMEERKAYVESNAKRRAEIQKKIQVLNEQRKKYVAEEMKKLQRRGETLGSAMIQAVRRQATARNFKFESSTEAAKKAEVKPQTKK